MVPSSSLFIPFSKTSLNRLLFSRLNFNLRLIECHCTKFLYASEQIPTHYLCNPVVVFTLETSSCPFHQHTSRNPGITTNLSIITVSSLRQPRFLTNGPSTMSLTTGYDRSKPAGTYSTTFSPTSEKPKSSFSAGMRNGRLRRRLRKREHCISVLGKSANLSRPNNNSGFFTFFRFFSVQQEYPNNPGMPGMVFCREKEFSESFF